MVRHLQNVIADDSKGKLQAIETAIWSHSESIYSKALDAIFCFCCKLFNKTDRMLVTEGFSNWKHQSDVLKGHDNFHCHLDAF